ncbi:MAG: YtpR family tRNA-binding protein, partial [Pseudomonadota bacterium]
MKFSEQWLREWIGPEPPREQLLEQLNMAGLEVDDAEPVAPEFEGVLVGEVVSVAPHPDADKLRVCQVNAGQDDLLNIVCGAPNVYEGMRAPVAVVGAKLPDDFKIKKAKLRGVESFGMLCSARELGLSEDHAGLFELPQDAPVGENVRDWLQLDDISIDVDLTPNRGDCLGLIGIARELSAINRLDMKSTDVPVVPAEIDDVFPIELVNAEACSRYVGRIIRGIDPKATSPLWMQEKLRRCGLRSISPTVDVTNYVMMEMGKPIHAFDFHKLSGGIRVRNANAGEKLTLLDGQELTLDDNTLVIADHQAAHA